MSAADTQALVTAWLAAWNTHDIEAVLAQFHDDACFVSPIAKQLIPDSQGSLKGKTAIRAYWQQALTLVPDLHFSLLGIYAGIDSLVIHYQNQKGVAVNEVLLLRDGKVAQGYATYALAASNPAGLR